MIEKTILDYMTERLAPIRVVMEIPADKPSEFVLIEKTGSSLENHLYDSMFAVQSYSASMYDAALLNDKVKEAMLEAITLDEVSAVRLNSDYNFTNASTKQYRYQAVFDISHY